MIQLVHVRNPLQPSDGRQIHQLEHGEQKNLRGYLIDASLDSDEIVVSINGRVLTAEETTAIMPLDGDCIVVVPRVEGGSLFRTLGQLALVAASAALIATGVGAPLGAALGLSGTTALAVGNAILGTAVTVGGNLVIGAISAALQGPSKTSTPSYAYDGPHSLAQSGTVIPKGDGKMRWGGNIIASFIDIEGADQYLNCLACFGFGPARALESIQINGKDVTTYLNVQYYTRLGTNDQTPLPNFNRVVNGYPQDTQCLAGQPVIVPGTGDLTQIIQVDVVFPVGLFVLTNDGNYIPLTLTWLVEYSVAGANSWQPVLQPAQTTDVVTYSTVNGTIQPYPAWLVVATDLPADSGVVYVTDNGSHYPGEAWSANQTVQVNNPDGTYYSYQKVCTGEWQPTNPLLNQVIVNNWTAGYQSATGCSTSSLYQRTNIYGLAPGKYDVRITKYGSARWGNAGNIAPGDNNDPRVGQQIWLHSVNEVSLLTLAYPNMILVGVRALATNQLSGSNVNITALVTHGLRTLDNNVLPAQLQAFEEDNPACVAADMMLDGLYGGGQWPGIQPANLNRYIDEWVSWAALNDELVDDGDGGSIRRHVFNGVFDSDGDLWSAIGTVAQMSRAAVIPLGRDYGVFVDGPDVPVQIFTAGNVLADSFTETWLDIDARANQVEIQFADSTRYYRQDNPLVYMDPANQDAGVAIKNTRLNGKGVTIPAQAWHLARYRERSNQFLLRSGSFNCSVDAIACRPGNVIILQNDMPQWGWGGRTLPGSTSSVVLLDRSDLDFVTGTTYSLVVLQPALERYSGMVQSVSLVTDGTGYKVGTQLTLSSFDNVQRVTRAVVGGTDCLILSAQAGAVVVQLPPGFTPAAAMAYQLWDTDVLETCSVSAVNLGEEGEDGRAALQVVTLSVPLSQAPQDYSTYFYGATGTQKLARVANIRKAGEFRVKVEWIDYDADIYTDATPTVGETSAQVTTKPGVAALTGFETFQRIGGSYVSFANLAWTNGPDTAGVGIYASLVGGNMNTNGGLPQMVARLTNLATTWQQQVTPGVTWKYTVVGFDLNDNYAAFSTAPSATIPVVGIATNLLMGSSFQNGFAYWNTIPRAGDLLVPNLANDGQAVYTVQGTPITDNRALFYQIVSPSKWSVGQSLMASAYVQDSCASASLPNSGNLTLSLVFFNAANTQIGDAVGFATLSGVSPSLTRINTPATAVPAGTASVYVWLGVDGGASNATHAVQVGSTITASHFLLETASVGQTLPSAWADIDVMGNILDLFQTGSSTGLRVQGSLIPSFTGSFATTFSNSGITVAWTSLVILWTDGAYTYIQDGSIAITGLQPATLYFSYPYFDVILGGVQFAPPKTATGVPAILSLAYDAQADAVTRQDNHIPFAPGGLQITTTTSGTGTGTGGGGYGGSGPVDGGGSPLLPSAELP